MELLYYDDVDDLVLVTDMEELLLERLRKWKNGMETVNNQCFPPELLNIYKIIRQIDSGRQMDKQTILFLYMYYNYFLYIILYR